MNKKTFVVLSLALTFIFPALGNTKESDPTFNGCGPNKSSPGLDLTTKLKRAQKLYRKVCGRDGKKFAKQVEQRKDHMAACSVAGGEARIDDNTFNNIRNGAEGACANLKKNLEKADQEVCKYRDESAAAAQRIAGNMEGGDEKTAQSENARMHRGLSNDNQKLADTSKAIKEDLTKAMDKMNDLIKQIHEKRQQADFVSSEKSPKYKEMLAARAGKNPSVSAKSLAYFEKNLAKCRAINSRGKGLDDLQKGFAEMKREIRGLNNDLASAESQFLRDREQHAATAAKGGKNTRSVGSLNSGTGDHYRQQHLTGGGFATKDGYKDDGIGPFNWGATEQKQGGQINKGNTRKVGY